ncbi:MAG: acyl-CoA thioester hydrolase [Flavobacteriales bacterium]|jgi:acyl-CoA thioester hydrolase
MYQHESKLRVRYAETDQMGYVYYGNYAQYYEIGRVELIRSLGISYKQLEESGVMLPVLDFKIRYVKPAYYDDELTIITKIEELPSTRITFTFECKNAEGVLLNMGEVVLVFVSMETGKPCHPTDLIMSKLLPYFK